MKPNFYNEQNLHKLFQIFMQAFFLHTQVKVLVEQSASGGVSYIDLVLHFDEVSEEDQRAIRAILADGMQDITEQCWVFELKASESCNNDGADQLCSNMYQYRTYNKLPYGSVAGILICLHVPQDHQLEKMGFTLNPLPGVYRCDCPGRKHMTLIAVSKLRDEANNVFLRLFSQQTKVREAAKQRIETDPDIVLNEDIELLFLGYLQVQQQYERGEITMEKLQTMTAKDVMEIGETHQRIMLQRMSEERLDKLLGDLPYIQKIKTQAEAKTRAEVRAEEAALARAEVWAEAEAKTRAEVWVEVEAKTRLQTLRSNILDLIKLRFKVSEHTLFQVETLLVQQKQAGLDKLFQVASLAESFAEFWAQAEQMESSI